MDEGQSTSSSTSSSGGGKNWLIIAIVIIAIVILVAAGGYYFMNSQKASTVVENQTPTPATEVEGSNTESEPQTNNYKDGTYTATGTYSYHSGEESVEVTVTIESGVVTDAKVVGKAVAPTSKSMQADFIANFEPMVVGKNIDEVKLGKVSGSSLTGIGFNAALEDIKSQAQS